MGTPFAGIIDQLRKAQPEAAKVVLPDITSRLPAAGQVAESIKRIGGGGGHRGKLPFRTVQPDPGSGTGVPWQGFAHEPGTARAPHPYYSDGSQPPLAFQQGFRDLRRNNT